MESKECYVTEIYSAIQGEGPLVGVRQIFVRLNICDLRCVWCDTPDSLIKTKECLLELSPGSREFKHVKNPISISDITSHILKLQPDLHHSVSITGGEPLVQIKPLQLLLSDIKKTVKLPVYLETGGHKSNEITKVIQYVDYLSMDFKLPSSAKTGNLWEAHKQFLENVFSVKPQIELWVKIVVTFNTLMDDLNKAPEIIGYFSSKHKKRIEIFLQPVTEVNGFKPPLETELLQIQSNMIQKYPYVRVVPQVHKLIGQR